MAASYSGLQIDPMASSCAYIGRIGCVYFGRLGCLVYGLALGTTDESLGRAFSQFGEINSVMIGIDPRTGENIGPVLFEDDRSVREAVVGMNGKKIGGHRITVKESRCPGLPHCAVTVFKSIRWILLLLFLDDLDVSSMVWRWARPMNPSDAPFLSLEKSSV